MPRGPYQGTFLPNVRQTVVTAPDAIVYINGEQEVIGCSQCSRIFDFNKYITSIQVDLSIESVPGSASVSMSIPRHTIDDFYFDGNPIITPMMEIEVYAKGYYLLEGIPQYYPIFWGIVTEVADNYSGGEHTVTLNCADILKWWDICKINVTPTLIGTSGQQGRNRENNVFAQTNPYDIIWSLALQSFGDIIVATGSFKKYVRDLAPKGAITDMMTYWERRFSRMRNNLVMYGTSGTAVRGDTLYAEYSRFLSPRQVRSRAVASSAFARANGKDGGQAIFRPESASVAAFKFVHSQVGGADLWQHTYQTKMELANAAKEAIGFEFYMDVTGDLIFKPPFYNLDVLGNKPVSWIQDIDILDWAFSESESEVVTQISMEGSLKGAQDLGTGAELNPRTYVTDYHLLRKYGWREQSYNSEFMADGQVMWFHGLDLLDRINSRRHRASLTIPMRSELRLGFPVYIAPKDQVWYTTGISHSIAFGSRATTSLTLTAKRSKFIAPRGMGELRLASYKGEAESDKDGIPRTFRYSSRQLSKHGVFDLKVGDAASLPPPEEFFEAEPGVENPYEPLVLRHPKTGRVVGYPNVVMAYTRPFVPRDIRPAAGQKTGKNPRVPKADQSKQEAVAEESTHQAYDRNIANEEDQLVDKYTTNRYQYGLTSAGVYIYAHDSSAGNGVVSEIITMKSANVQVTPETETSNISRSKTSIIRPVSDERGFEVIGHYRYGRRVFLRDGSLILGNEDDRTTVDVQLALSGDLQSVLTAQSQGLTTISSGYVDPAAAITTLSPDERQTAAVVNPKTKEPELVDAGDNFTGAPPLGSQEQKGAPESVEATQLSRALTLMEMSVRDSVTREDENCVCLTGRQDLAFINSGYQIRTLSNSSDADLSILKDIGIEGGSVTSEQIEQEENEIEELQEELVTANARLLELMNELEQDPASQAKYQAVLDQQGNVDSLDKQLTAAQNTLSAQQSRPITSGATNKAQGEVSQLESELAAAHSHLSNLIDEVADDPENKAKFQATLDQQKVIDDLDERLAAAQDGVETLRMVRNTENPLVKKDSDIISKVDKFLTDLYISLDTPHQEFEKAIRGDLLPMSPRVVATSAEEITRPSEFAPPFSAPNRFALGDPEATDGAIETNANNITQAWSDFGKKLRSNTAKASLTKQISQDQASIARLTKTRERLVEQQQSSAVVIGINVPKAIESIDAQLVELRQNVLDNQTKLSTGT
jgi:hypothetical protein